MLTVASLRNQEEDFPTIGGVIMIDCWPSGIWDPHLAPFYQTIIKQLAQHQIQQAVVSCYSHDTYTSGLLCPELRDYFRDRSNMTEVTKVENFIELNQTWGIKNWLVVGLSWQRCVHTRPMGLIELGRKTTNEQFYLDPQCILHENTQRTLNVTDFREDALMWQKVKGLGYRLVK